MNREAEMNTNARASEIHLSESATLGKLDGSTVDTRPMSEIEGPHESQREATKAEFYAPKTFASWLALSVFLVSFGIVINNTNKTGERKASTAMCCLGFVWTVWASIVYFRAAWPIQHRPALIAQIGLIVIFLIITVWLVARIW